MGQVGANMLQWKEAGDWRSGIEAIRAIMLHLSCQAQARAGPCRQPGDCVQATALLTFPGHVNPVRHRLQQSVGHLGTT